MHLTKYAALIIQVTEMLRQTNILSWKGVLAVHADSLLVDKAELNCLWTAAAITSLA